MIFLSVHSSQHTLCLLMIFPFIHLCKYLEVFENERQEKRYQDVLSDEEPKNVVKGVDCQRCRFT